MGAFSVNDSTRTGIFISSVVDARPLVAVAKELVNRQVPVRVYLVGRPGWRAAQAIVEEAGFAGAVIGKNKPLNTSRFLRGEGLAAILLSIDALYWHSTLITTARRLGIVSVLVQEAANELIQTIAVRKGPGVLLRQLDRAWFQARAMFWNGGILSLAKLVGQTILGRPRHMAGYGFHEVDLFCTATERIASIYRSRGARAHEMAPTGVPELIPAIESRPTEYDYVVLTQPFNIGGLLTPREKKAVFSELVGVIRDAHPNARILCKVHPSEDASEYEGLHVDAFADDLAEAIAVSRIAVSVHSASLLTALANGRLAIAFVPPMLGQSKNIVMIELEPFGLVVHDAHSLARLVTRIRRGELTPDDVRHVRQAWSDCVDGKAAARIADRVCGLLDRGVVHSQQVELADDAQSPREVTSI